MSNTTIVRVLNSAFVVKPCNSMLATFKGYLQRMYHYEFKKSTSRAGGVVRYDNKRELKEKWVLESPELNEYRIHISYLREFREHFKNYRIEYTVVTPNMGGDVDFKMKDFFEPRGEQVGWIKFLSAQKGTHTALGASMGLGKTVTMLATLAEIGKRAVIILPPFLSDRWLLEIDKFTTLDKKQYVYISGKKLLKSYMTTIELGHNPWAIVIFGINTLRNYFRDYYLNPEEWIYSPQELFDAGDFGIRGIDEAHKELHFHYISTLFLNMGRYIGLSGTLGKENEFLNGMAERLFPIGDRCPVDDVVASTECGIYKMYFEKWIPKHVSPMGYSHVIYENNIRFHPSVKDAYFMSLARIFYSEFVAISVTSSDKGLIFLATVKLAEEFADFLSSDSRLTQSYGKYRIGRLRAGEPDDKCDEMDIVVTTTGRAGTGVDVEGVLTVFNTISISDKYLQMQVLGRGRKRKDGMACRYVRLYSPDISKHVTYHLKALTALRSLCTEVVIRNLPGTIPYPTGYDFEYAKKLASSERKERDMKKKLTARRRNIRKRR